jgi:hypothetical protein
MGNILKLIEHWDKSNNEYWLEIEPIAADASENRILLGSPCRSIAEFDKLISEMQADLRSLTAEGHVKMAYHELENHRASNERPSGIRG